MTTRATRPPLEPSGDAGFTLMEMMVTVVIFMIVSGAVMKGVFDLTGVHNVIINRTDMHNGVRNATELLTQEIGQAGRVSLPAPVTLNAATPANPGAANTVQPGQAYTAAAAGPTFGRLTSTVGRTVGLGTPRQVQFALRYSF